MASNLLELRRAAGYRSAGDFAEAHGIPVSTYARYEGNPDKIPLRAAWQLADALGTTIDAVVGRAAPAPGTARGEVQLEYDGLTPEVRALADEFRAFVLQKDKKVRAIRNRDEERFYEALCYQYERQMFAEMHSRAGFGEIVAFGSAAEARAAFLDYLKELAARKRGEFSTEASTIADDLTIERIMAVYDRTHGEYEVDGMDVVWSSVDRRAALGEGIGTPKKWGGATT